MHSIDSIQRIVLAGECFDFTGIIHTAVKAKIRNKLSVSILFIVNQDGTGFDVISERLPSLLLRRFTVSLEYTKNASRVTQNPDTHLIYRKSAQLLSVFVCDNLITANGIECLVQPRLALKNKVFPVFFEKQEQLFEPVPRGCKGVAVVPRICVDAHIAENVQRVVDPFTDGNFMSIKDGTGNGRERLIAVIASIPLDAVPCMTVHPDVPA